MKQVAAGLGHAHGRGVVHRDVKPANVMIVRHGPSEIAKISDFGIARLVHGEKRTQGQLTLGTLWYLAPEQAQSSSVDARADVYALGATLYEALTGRVVFPYDNVARVLAAALAEPPTPPSSLAPGIAPALDELVLRFIAKRPEARPSNGDEARTLLEHVEQQLEATDDRSGPFSIRSLTPSRAVQDLAAIAPAHGAPSPSMAPTTQAAPPATPQPSHAAPSFAHAPAPFAHSPALASPAQPLAPAPAAAPLAPPTSNVPTDSNQLGLWIGVGVVALVSVMCLLSAFLCVAHDRGHARRGQPIAERGHEATAPLHDHLGELLVGARLDRGVDEARHARHRRRAGSVTTTREAVAARAVRGVERCAGIGGGRGLLLRSRLVVALGQLVIARSPLAQLTRGRPLGAARRDRGGERDGERDARGAGGVW
jgi:hypothetical protein